MSIVLVVGEPSVTSKIRALVQEYYSVVETEYDCGLHLLSKLNGSVFIVVVDGAKQKVALDFVKAMRKTKKVPVVMVSGVAPKSTLQELEILAVVDSVEDPRVLETIDYCNEVLQSIRNEINQLDNCMSKPLFRESVSV